MVERIWDPEGKYKEGFTKEYNHWALEVSFCQHTLGCFIIFAKRQVEKVSDLTNEEVVELRDVMKEYESTLSKMEDFKPDRFNYLQMGNSLHQLHFHAIPRYETTRHFKGRQWQDKTFGHPPNWAKVEEPVDMIKAIKEKFLFHLEK